YACQPGDSPHELAGCELDAAEICVLQMPAAFAVEVAIAINRRTPVALHAFVEAFLRVGPHDLVAAGPYLQERAAGTVGLRNKDLVLHYHWIRGVDAFQNSRPPGKVEINGPGGRVE